MQDPSWRLNLDMVVVVDHSILLVVEFADSIAADCRHYKGLADCKDHSDSS